MQATKPKRAALWRANVQTANDDDALLALPAVQLLTSAARSTIYDAIKAGTFPRQAKQSRRFARWRAGDVRAWLRNEWKPAAAQQAAA